MFSSKLTQFAPSIECSSQQRFVYLFVSRDGHLFVYEAFYELGLDFRHEFRLCAKFDNLLVGDIALVRCSSDCFSNIGKQPLIAVAPSHPISGPHSQEVIILSMDEQPTCRVVRLPQPVVKILSFGDFLAVETCLGGIYVHQSPSFSNVCSIKPDDDTGQISLWSLSSRYIAYCVHYPSMCRAVSLKSETGLLDILDIHLGIRSRVKNYLPTFTSETNLDSKDAAQSVNQLNDVILVDLKEQGSRVSFTVTYEIDAIQFDPSGKSLCILPRHQNFVDIRFLTFKYESNFSQRSELCVDNYRRFKFNEIPSPKTLTFSCNGIFLYWVKDDRYIWLLDCSAEKYNTLRIPVGSDTPFWCSQEQKSLNTILLSEYENAVSLFQVRTCDSGVSSKLSFFSTRKSDLGSPSQMYSTFEMKFRKSDSCPSGLRVLKPYKYAFYFSMLIHE